MQAKREEELLIKRIIKRDERALLEVFNQFKKPVFRYICRQLNDKNLSQEVTQDVFIDFIEALRDFNHKCSLKTFIFSIARNKTIDVIRKKKIKRILFSALPNYIVEGLKTIFIDEEIEKNELQKRIKYVLNSLPNDYSLVLRLKYIQGEKVKEISKKLSMKFKATESLIFRARKAFIKVFKFYENRAF